MLSGVGRKLVMMTMMTTMMMKVRSNSRVYFQLICINTTVFKKITTPCGTYLHRNIKAHSSQDCKFLWISGQLGYKLTFSSLLLVPSITGSCNFFQRGILFHMAINISLALISFFTFI